MWKGESGQRDKIMLWGNKDRGTLQTPQEMVGARRFELPTSAS
jgi:hypothetical protein